MNGCACCGSAHVGVFTRPGGLSTINGVDVRERYEADPDEAVGLCGPCATALGSDDTHGRHSHPYLAS